MQLQLIENKSDLDIYLDEKKEQILGLAKRTTEDIIHIGSLLVEVKQKIGHGNFQRWYENELGWSPQTITRFINVSEKFSENFQIGNFEQSALYLLSAPFTPEQARQEAIALAEEGEKISHKKAKEIVAKYRIRTESDKRGNVFNETNENIDWAKWTWNPVTGCKHGCKYCYARDIANRFYKEKFEPTFRSYRLKAPFNTIIPEERSKESGINNVFVCSMADLFGQWVPQNWIDSVIDTVRNSPQWNYIFLTKNPDRLIDIDWPNNAWVGATIDIQSRIKKTEQAFKEIKAKVKFVSCEPLSEELNFTNLTIFDWVIIGARSKSSKMKAIQPERQWVLSLINQAHESGCMVYCKPNLKTMIKEYPI